MLTDKYMGSVANLPAIMRKIVEGAAPAKFTQEHLKGLGFTSSTDRSVIPILKELGFLTGDGVPTARYHAYRDPTKSKRILGEALREAYQDLFLISERLGDGNRDEIAGKFKSTHNVSDWVAQRQALTFLTFLSMADIDQQQSAPLPPPRPDPSLDGGDHEKELARDKSASKGTPLGGLHYTVEIHLPATKDIDVFNAIFKSLKEHLID